MCSADHGRVGAEMKDVRDWVSLFAAIGHLSIAVTAMLSARKSALARPLAGLCFVLFGWNFATLAHHVIGGSAFEVFDAAFTALSPAALFELVLTFVGQSKRLRPARALVWGAFGALSAASFTGLFSKAMLDWIDRPSWSIWFLVAWVPSIVFEVWLLVRHLRSSSEQREKARTRIVLVALAIGATFSTSDVARALGLPLPYLGAIGTLIAAALLMTLAVRFELFDRNVSVWSGMYVLGMIVAFVVAYLVIFRVFIGNLAAQAFATAVVTLLLVVVARELAAAYAEARERRQRLTVLGRFSAQMAHDIKGPLAALLGAVQVLEGSEGDDEDAKRTRKEFLDLLGEQAKRIVAIVDRYDRMGRIEPRKTTVRVDDVVRAVARAHALAEGTLHLAGNDLECEADAELFESALENVVRNAVEATGDAARVRVETERAARTVVVRVIDRGEGMDARQLERAFEDFFTTKAMGSGLGLPFVRRVLLAHGGDVAMKSERGVGTTVELRLPVG
jgi:two-component system, NtrC family, sensor histidine kinase HydH